MLLEFRAKNYRSFKDEFVFSMIPAAKQKDLSYSVLKKNAGGREYKALCSSVVYGPNAAGKSNIISAMDTLKKILQRGNVLNPDESSVMRINPPSVYLDLIPFISGDENNPTSFFIKFITEDMLIEYSFTVALGKFASLDYERDILEESLCVNGLQVFLRGKSDGANTLALSFDGFKGKEQYLNEKVLENFDSLCAISLSSLNKTELFLTSGFKTIVANKFVEAFLTWINKKFIVIYQADGIQVGKKMSDSEQDHLYIDDRIDKAAKIFGISSNSIGFIYPDGKRPVLSSVFKNGEDMETIPARLFESYGTVRFINEFPLVITAILSGGTLVVDEFDASLHPMALMNIINIFHNDEINRNNAQLIFNTHNPIFLDKNLYRRDEIKFVERDEETGASSLYSLSDFKTYGTEGRNNADYMKNYFLDRYGAIKDIDFSQAFIEWMNQAEEKKAQNG